ncbi:MAG TPA: hypothetical protein VNA27_01345 [Rubrobacteraceae bacterium]|nr:hypothetical protein [Rubrobacteraceae bacterium]
MWRAAAADEIPEPERNLRDIRVVQRAPDLLEDETSGRFEAQG